MNLLLDTHVFIWHVMADHRLGMQHRRILTDPANTLFLSAASIFEMSVKVANGKLELPHHYKNNLPLIYEEHDFVPLVITPHHANAAGQLPGVHRDPFDRLLAAQSIVEAMLIMSGDKQIAGLGAQVVW